LNSKKEKTDWGLRFYLDVFKLKSLHFGLWDESDPLTLEGMRRAQERYTRELMDMAPEGVRTVLDAGCGTGSTTEELLKRGYEVECLNPDSYQEKIFRENIKENIPFHRVKFEEFTAEKKFDLILMSESSQYMDTEKMAENALRLLNPGGWLLIADYFRLSDTDFYKSCKIFDEFMGQITKCGFEPVKDIDITLRTIPTLRLGKLVYEEYGLPTINILGGYIRDKHPIICKMLLKLFSKKISRVNRYLNEHTSEKLDEEKFRKNMKYIFLLFRKKEKESL